MRDDMLVIILIALKRIFITLGFSEFRYNEITLSSRRQKKSEKSFSHYCSRKNISKSGFSFLGFLSANESNKRFGSYIGSQNSDPDPQD